MATPLPDDILDLVNLNYLSLDINIQFGSSFWTGFGIFSQLKEIYIQEISEAFPTNLGSLLPRSLEIFYIQICNYLTPESLFTDSNLQEVNIGTFNTLDINIFPSSISSPSTIKSFSTTSRGAFNLIGTNFVNIEFLSIYFTGTVNEVTYNSYDTWSTRQIHIQYNSEVPFSKFPSSLLSMASLQSFTFRGGNKVIFDSSIQLLDFSNSPNLFSISIYEVDTLDDLVSPGFKVNSNAFLLIIYNSVIDLSVMDYFGFEGFISEGSTLIGSIPDGNYSQMSSLRIAEAPTFTGSLPDSICRIKYGVTLQNTGINSLPACFICEWGNPDVSDGFVDNPNLPAYTYNCPTLQVINYTTSLPTNGGKITIYGVDMGWKVFQENNDPFNTIVQIGNEVLIIDGPPGTGVDKSMNVKFHSIANPLASTYTLNFDYLPPTVTSISPSGTYINFYGQNFSPNTLLVDVYVAGQKIALQRLDYFSIFSEADVIPWGDNVTVSVRIVVDGQEFSNVFKPPGFDPIFGQPFPVLYSGGGFVEFTGQFFTFDTTIMNLTINGILFSGNIVESSSSRYLIEYDPIQAGMYPLEYNLLDYQVTGTIEVSDTPSCVVVHGYCIGPKPVCFSPYTGPDCNSIPSNLTQVTMNDSFPIIKSNTFQTTWKGEKSNFVFSIYPKSNIEYDINGEIVAKYLPSSFEFTSNGNSLSEIGQYIAGPMNGNTATVYNIITFNVDYLSTSNSIGTPIVEVPSSYGFQNAFQNYTFASLDNHLEFTYQIDIEIINPTIPLCSRIERNTLPNSINTDYLKLKVNHLDFYTRISKTASDNSFPEPADVVYTNINQQAQKISQEITFKVNAFEGFYIYDFDFTVLFDEVSAADESTPMCATFTPAPTKPVDKPCPGSPACGGSQQGKCLNGVCNCIGDWKGIQCDLKDDILPPIDNPDITKPTINTSKDEIGLHVSIVSIRELDFMGNTEREQFISNWTFTQEKSDEKQTYIYKTNPFDDNNTTFVLVQVDYFYKDTQIEFAGKTSTKLAGSIKYSANITSWPFLIKTNQLQVIFSSSAQDNTESSDSCTLKSIEYSDDQEDNVEIVYIQVNDKTFSSRFNDLAVVDGVNRQVSNVEIPNTLNDSNTQSSSLIGVLTPHHNDFVLIDPDFSLLLSYSPIDEKEGSICLEKSKKKLTNAQLAGIIIGAIVFLAVVIAITIYAIRFNRQKKALSKLIQQKIKTVTENK